MITGSVNDKLEATVRLTVRGSNAQSQEVTAVIDTGYNGAITLPVALVSTLLLLQGASREVTLGDTSRQVFDYYTAEVDWDGQTRKVRVLCVEGDPLIGTSLLHGYKLDADFVVDGAVILTKVR